MWKNELFNFSNRTIIIWLLVYDAIMASSQTILSEVSMMPFGVVPGSEKVK